MGFTLAKTRKLPVKACSSAAILSYILQMKSLGWFLFSPYYLQLSDCAFLEISQFTSDGLNYRFLAKTLFLAMPLSSFSFHYSTFSLDTKIPCQQELILSA